MKPSASALSLGIGVAPVAPALGVSAQVAAAPSAIPSFALTEARRPAIPASFNGTNALSIARKQMIGTKEIGCLRMDIRNAHIALGDELRQALRSGSAEGHVERLGTMLESRRRTLSSMKAFVISHVAATLERTQEELVDREAGDGNGAADLLRVSSSLKDVTLEMSQPGRLPEEHSDLAAKYLRLTGERITIESSRAKARTRLSKDKASAYSIVGATKAGVEAGDPDELMAVLHGMIFCELPVEGEVRTLAAELLKAGRADDIILTLKSLPAINTAVAQSDQA